jgi:hypothetical protein
MYFVNEKCERCGGGINNQGTCSSCGFNQRQHEAESNSLAARMEGMLTASGSPEPATPPVAASLTNKATNDRYSLGQSVNKIGRDLTNSISLVGDSYISRHHAWILYIKGSYWIEDLGSTNGTLVNGEILNERRQLTSGDCLKLGRTELLFNMG